jgi:hypothetical protein
MYLSLSHAGIVEVPAVAPEGVRAFPGAEGLAANTRGAAGYSGTKSVAIVSNLNDSGAGSFRDAVAGAGKEGTFVTFTTSGIINAPTNIQIDSDFITIAGQTSPGGICLAGSPLITRDNQHAIMRHFRSIAGSHQQGGTADNESFRIRNASDIMVDHCSFAWGGDETTSVTDFNGDPCQRITYSKCIISQGLTDPAPEPDHGFGTLCNFNNNITNSIDFYKCYYAHHQRRSPRIAGDGFVNVVNCVIYDWDAFTNTRIFPGDDFQMNYIGNYAKPGTNSEGPYTGAGRSGELNADLPFPTAYELLFMENNFGVVRTGDADAEWAITADATDALLSTDYQSLSEFASPAGGIALTKTVLIAATAEAQAAAILADCGATKPSRDSHDTQMVADFNDDTGTFKADSTYPDDWPTYSTPAAPTDTDGDGIPDSFEIANGFTATSMDPFATAPSGYLWIEEYINSLA